MDSVDKQGAVADLPKEDFGGIEMYRQASVEIGSLADAAAPYAPRAVDRSTVFTFDEGRTVYELTDPAGSTYVMQTWSQQKDPSLEEDDLAGLGDRLQLPDRLELRAAHVGRAAPHRHDRRPRPGAPGRPGQQLLPHVGLIAPTPGTHRLASSPITSAPEVSTSPGARNLPRAMPTPDGVPVKTRSPGCSVQIDER